VLREIRRTVGRDFVVGARISGDEFTRGGLTAGDMAEIARRLAASGMLDFLSIIGGGAHTYELQAAAVPNMSYATGVFVPLAAAIKQPRPVSRSFTRAASSIRPMPIASWPRGRSTSSG
jgi:2,4-dienoyl-CoA reductase-like NADH-dependent reductase (Old Yellow Enzyme family)